MPRLNRFGNRLVNRAFAFIHGRDLVDILSGYRAFTRSSFERFRLTADGFGIETEMAVECVKHGVTTEVVGVSYGSRPSESETNLHPVKDGARIYLTLFRLAKTNNPLFYFGSVGTAALLAGLTIGAYVGYEWFIREPRVAHEALAIVGASGIILGVQLLMFGVLSDVIVAVNREQTRRLEELARRLDEGRDRQPDATGSEHDRPDTGVADAEEAGPGSEPEDDERDDGDGSELEDEGGGAVESDPEVSP
jgi:dolichol-phosphate mannosyltransferase